MNGAKLYSATEVRKNWSDIIDMIQNNPIKVSRNKKNTFSIVPMSIWESLLESYDLNLIIEKDEDSFIGQFEEFDLLSSEETEEETIEDLKVQLIEYADLFIEDLNYFSKDKNRMEKLPHLLKIFMFPEKIDQIIHIKYK